MVKLASLRVIMTFFVAISIVAFMTSCGETAQAITISYTLPLVPITFSLDSNGNISVSASAHLVTELGEISVSAGVQATPFPVPDNVLLVTIRHRVNGNLVDTSYQINTEGQGRLDVQGNISEVTVGWTGKSNSVFIDASNGDITSIVLQGTGAAPVATTVVPTDTPTPTPSPIPTPQPSNETSPCPTSPEEAANLFGGNASHWARIPNTPNGWHYGPTADAIPNLHIPQGYLAQWWDNYNSHQQQGSADVGYASEASVWC